MKKKLKDRASKVITTDDQYVKQFRYMQNNSFGNSCNRLSFDGITQIIRLPVYFGCDRRI